MKPRLQTGIMKIDTPSEIFMKIMEKSRQFNEEEHSSSRIGAQPSALQSWSAF
jgi:hypothetical protein